jgi:hypothetical protein
MRLETGDWRERERVLGIMILHNWGSRTAPAHGLDLWRGQEWIVCEGACGDGSATVVHVHNTARISMCACFNRRKSACFLGICARERHCKVLV